MDNTYDWENLGEEDSQNNKKDEVYSKTSGEKTVEERIKTSRSLKIKHNKWNQIDYTEDFSNEKIVIDPNYYHSSSTISDVELEKKYYAVIENSKYKELLLGEEKTTINYQVIHDIIIYCFIRLKQDYTLTQVFVMTCEYCGVGLLTMFKRLSSYLQMQILEELSEVSKLPKDMLDNQIKFF